MVLSRFVEELQGDHLSDRVIEIVERIFEDVRLSLPESAGGKELVSFIRPMRQIGLFKLSPVGLSLMMRKLRMLIGVGLERIDDTAIRNEGERIAEVLIAVLFRVFLEEKIHPRIGQILHRHRVHFRTFHTRSPIGRNVGALGS